MAPGTPQRMLKYWSNFTVLCANAFKKLIINNKWATDLTYTSRNQIQLDKDVNMT